MQLSVLVIDLVGYSERLAALEEQVSNAGETLNRQIEAFVSAAITSARLALADTILKFTGDGAILKAPDAERAHRIAIALQEASAEFNRGKQTELGKRVFRVGIATGEVSSYESASGTIDHGGSTIGRAARMEAGCKPGGVMIDAPSFETLPADLRSLYKGPETLVDKNKAEYVAYRLKDECMTRLQTALSKCLAELGANGNPELAQLLEKMPFAKDVPTLLSWMAQPDHGAVYAIEKLRDVVLSFPKHRSIDDSSVRPIILLFLVCAEQRLRAELINALGANPDLKITLSDASVRNLIAVGLKNCGLHFEIDPSKRAIKPTNIVSDLPIMEPGGNRLDRFVFEELHERERGLRKLDPTLDRSAIQIDQAAMRARLRLLDETESLQIVVAFAAGSPFANDAQVSALLKDLGIPYFHHGVVEADSTVDVQTARDVGESLASQLRDLLEILTPSTAPPVNTVKPPSTSKPIRPLVFLSYARADDVRFKQAMALQLKGLEQMGLIELFIDDRDIQLGQYWDDRIRAKLDQAYVAIFMLSPNFLASDFIMQDEVPVLMKLAPHERVIPVVVSDCVWRIGAFGALQAPLNAHTLQQLNELELNAATVQIATHIAKLCRQYTQAS